MEKNNFETLAENRNELIQRLAMDDELAKCLLNKSTNFKETTVTKIEKSKLINTQIFPYLKTTGNLDTAKTYITMKFKYKRSKSGNVFKAANVTFYVLCSDTLSIITTPYGVLRPDYVLMQIDRLINDTRGDGWIGKMTLEGMDDVVDQSGKFIGLTVTYTNTEFQ